MVRRWVLVVTCGILGTFCAASARPVAGQVRGQIFGPGLRNFPVAISPLATGGGGGAAADLGTKFADIVTRDLELSGQFRIIDRGAYIEKAEPYTADAINFPNWSVIGALALVKGAVQVTGDRLFIEARLFDVYQRRELGGEVRRRLEAVQVREVVLQPLNRELEEPFGRVEVLEPVLAEILQLHTFRQRRSLAGGE